MKVILQNIPACPFARFASGCLVLFALAFSSQAAAAASAPPDPKPAEEKAQSNAPAAIPLAQLAAEADAVILNLRKMMADVATPKELAAIEAELPVLSREIDARARENKGILAQGASVELLRELDSRWADLRSRLAATTERLERRIASLEDHVKQIGDLEKLWTATAERAAQESAPPELIGRIRTLLTQISAGRKDIEAQRTLALKLQTRVADLDLRVTDVLQSNRAARDAAIARMFMRDSLPLWDPAWRARAFARIVAGANDAFEAQWTLLAGYVTTHASRFAAHIALLAVLAAIFYLVRRQLTSPGKVEANTDRAATIVRYPIASAMVITLLLTHWIYPQAPRLMGAIAGTAVLIPTILLLRCLVSPYLRLPLYAVIAFYVVDQVRTISASIDVLPRFLFVVEMFAAAALLLWFRRRRAVQAGEQRHRVLTARLAVTLGTVLCAATALANAAGYVSFANLIGDALLDSMYAGLVLFAVVQILDAVVSIAMQVRPLSALNMVRTHRAILQRRIRSITHWGAITLWVLYVLNLLAVRDRAFEAVKAALDAELSIGQIDISLSAVISFGLAIWAAFLVSRLVRFVLNEEVFPHAPLQRGIPYAISQSVHFVIIAVGFVIAMGIIGMEMTQFTILASAFTVGIGFGLQNIFNNFVSGLIVLFERPVQVGDVIQIEDAMGVVERIGIRASVVRTASGSEVIVPNGKLISDRVVNWTLSGRKRVIELPIAVVLQSDPEKVITILEDVARRHQKVLKDPPAQAIITRLGPDWMGFELRAASSEVEDWMKIRSDLAISATVALRAADVTLR